ncbi:hypothetical protein niasHT_031925 [Heterodera trifolii]|uniref:Uncharacterized protein n=1 Tax=Heterodera trifolii TaxID=157864 RepID=A0ABD2I2E0_9BILA
MPNIFKILLIVLLAVISFSLSASTETANDGIGTKIKRIVTAGLLFTSLATGGAEAIGRSNAQGGNAAGLVPSHVTNRAMVPPPHPAQFEKTTPVEKTRASLQIIAEKTPSKGTNRLVPGGSNPRHN